MRYNSAFDSYLNHTNFSNRISMLLFFFLSNRISIQLFFFSLLADRLCQRRYKCIMGAKLEELRVHGQIKKKEKKNKTFQTSTAVTPEHYCIYLLFMF